MCVCMCVCIESSYKELSHMIMKAEKSRPKRAAGVVPVDVGGQRHEKTDVLA